MNPQSEKILGISLISQLGKQSGKSFSDNVLVSILKLIAPVLLLLLCNPSYAQNLPIPENYTVIDSVSGDLDRDGIPELVVAYDTRKQPEDTLESVPRELIIYKTSHNGWEIWKRSMQALYGSRSGGMMGDPFEAITIEKRILLVSQNGGSSWKWGHTDKYRYQHDGFYQRVLKPVWKALRILGNRRFQCVDRQNGRDQGI